MMSTPSTPRTEWAETVQHSINDKIREWSMAGLTPEQIADTFGYSRALIETALKSKAM